MLSARATKLVLLGLMALAVAIGALAVWARKPGPTKLTNWPPPLTDAQARAQLTNQCQAAAADQRLLLVEFSAPWCEHCQAVKKAVTDARVQPLLSAVRPLVLNVGEDEVLNALRLELGARAIPAWVVVEPTRCEQSPASYPRVQQTYPRGEPAELVSFLSKLTER
jgi:thiol:disulfide interchange protein